MLRLVETSLIAFLLIAITNSIFQYKTPLTLAYTKEEFKTCAVSDSFCELLSEVAMKYFIIIFAVAMALQTANCGLYQVPNRKRTGQTSSVYGWCEI